MKGTLPKSEIEKRIKYLEECIAIKCANFKANELHNIELLNVELETYKDILNPISRHKLSHQHILSPEDRSKLVFMKLCEFHGVSYDLMCTDTYIKKQKREVVEIRQITWYISRNVLKPCISLPKLSLMYGKDHVTILYGTKQISWLLTNNKPFIEKYNRIIKYLEPYLLT